MDKTTTQAGGSDIEDRARLSTELQGGAGGHQPGWVGSTVPLNLTEWAEQ